MLSNARVYAVKKRKKPVQKTRKTHAPDVVKTNPSKRHRDRLNGELDRLTGLLPFPEDVRSRLDKLSVLRLSVGYLKVKSFFKATMKKSSVLFPGRTGMDTTTFSEGDLLLQALNGFVLVVTAEGHVFYSSPTVQDYLGFHQSDVVHQSVFELIHTDDRAIFRRQLHFALNPQPFDPEQGDGMASSSDITRNTVTYNPEQLPPENSSFLERNFVCRFRCLLDNSSGFLALNFQGRLKFLHGQSMLAEDGSRTQPKLALFTIATPVQTPSILEIRTKTIFFQTKHKLDFTPMGVDARGKVVLGYSEIELCMRGSGYQFIHAADMMYCADNHVRMIKTGESGLTTFRLLQKTGCWVWVQANARFVYKGGRPDFIIARQRPLVNSEGEEHLRQRKMQLPFNFATGEALLYETGPTLDAAEFQANTPKISKVESLDPQSLLGSLLKQDESIYIQPQEPQLPIEQAFMDSRALTNVDCNSWQGSAEPQGPGRDSGGDSGRSGKREGAVLAIIEALEKMERDGELCAALQGLDVDTAELTEWESALLRLSQDANMTVNGDVSLDDIMTNDIFSYVEDALFKESGEGGSDQPNSCAVVNNMPNSDLLSEAPDGSSNARTFTEPLGATGIGHCKPGLLADHSFDDNGSPMNCPSQCQGADNGPVVSAGQNQPVPHQMMNGSQRLSHFPPQILGTDVDIPTLQQLQLNDIFTPSLVLPELCVPGGLGHNGSFGDQTAGSCAQAPNKHMESPQGMTGRVHSNRSSAQHFSRNGSPNGPQQFPVPQSNHVTASLVDAWASMVPGIGFEAAQNESIHPNRLVCPQGNTAQFQQQPYQQQLQSPASAVQNELMLNGHAFVPDCLSQAMEIQRVPLTDLWSPSNNGLYQPQQGGLANGQLTPSSSCMFEKVPLPLANGNSQVDDVRLAHQLSVCHPQGQSPPKGSCYFRWSPSEPVVGASAIRQDNTSISPQSCPLEANLATHEGAEAMQQYLAGCSGGGQRQISSVVDTNGPFSLPPLVNGAVCFSEHNQTNYCNF